MQIQDLRQIHSRGLQPLFQEEADHWRKELYWDYRPSQHLIRKFIDSHSLAGYAAMEGKQPVGYGFYVFEDQKGLIGGLFASPQCDQVAVSKKLLLEMFDALRATPFIERIEAQLMPFGTALDATLEEQNFRLRRRQFMLLELPSALPFRAQAQNGLRLEAWTDKCLEPCARLIQRAYADHVDSEINDQYRTEVGATKFLRNIVLLPGCGQFCPEASFIVRPGPTETPIAMVLTSTVAPGIGHTTQICVLPGYQKNGLGRRLMEASLSALNEHGYRALTLTVTATNANAVRLYENLGFQTRKTFAAGVWQPH
ncbi:MAG TPA: GNAT family N-acetyltransferase [Candidatus Acidoferrales bacterium]|nr:GNAT family N-acetyltransferase [Candidatus Acidoferrales bacterium]